MTHRSLWLRVGLTGIVTLLGASFSTADVLYLKTGGQLEGVVTHETPESVTIDVSMGQVSVPRGRVLRIERKESALSQYRSRLGATDARDPRAWAELARFANRNHLRSESREAWAAVLSLDPMNEEAHLALGHVLSGGRYVDEAEAYRANGFVYFDHQWMTRAEQSSLLREREERRIDDRRVEEARRAARDAEDRARRAEAEAARARAEISIGYPVWGFGSGVFVGSPYWGGSVGCPGAACPTPPTTWPKHPPRPAAPAPLPLVRPRPASWR